MNVRFLSTFLLASYATANDIVAVASGDPDFTTLVAAIIQADLQATLETDGPLTVFAPTESAFANANINLDDVSDEDLASILLYHVVPGEFTSDALADDNELVTAETSTISVESVCNQWWGCWSHQYELELNGGVSITQADISASNGIIHAIDTVLMPPVDIVTVASRNPDFSTLVNAIIQANLQATLETDGPFTVFAPTESAFADLGVDLDTIPLADLTNILLYHVVPGEFTSDALADENELVTAETSTISVESVCNQWWGCWSHQYELELNGGVSIIQADISASNG